MIRKWQISVTINLDVEKKIIELQLTWENGKIMINNASNAYFDKSPSESNKEPI